MGFKVINEFFKKNRNFTHKISKFLPEKVFQFHNHLFFQVFECCWDKCDFQFEDPGDLLEHCVSDGNGCVHKYFSKISESPVYHCLWRNCIRLKRNLPSLPNMGRLIKHVRDVHAVKGIGKIIQPNDRSKNYMSSTRKHMNIHLNQGHSQNMHNNYSSQPIMTTPISTGSPQIIYTGSQQPQTVINCKLTEFLNNFLDFLTNFYFLQTFRLLHQNHCSSRFHQDPKESYIPMRISSKSF